VISICCTEWAGAKVELNIFFIITPAIFIEFLVLEKSTDQMGSDNIPPQSVRCFICSWAAGEMTGLPSRSCQPPPSDL
jgi:hypothetical protein